MVGPGAGIAPFKAFADEKDFVKQKGIYTIVKDKKIK